MSQPFHYRINGISEFLSVILKTKDFWARKAEIFVKASFLKYRLNSVLIITHKGRVLVQLGSNIYKEI